MALLAKPPTQLVQQKMPVYLSGQRTGQQSFLTLRADLAIFALPWVPTTLICFVEDSPEVAWRPRSLIAWSSAHMGYVGAALPRKHTITRLSLDVLW